MAPYIHQHLRLKDSHNSETPGELAYHMFKALEAYCYHNGTDVNTISHCYGAMESAKQEFARKIADKCYDHLSEIHGDIK